MIRVFSIISLAGILEVMPSLVTRGGSKPRASGCCDGEVWLSMNKAERHAFAVGFIYGDRRGHKDGCTDYDEIARLKFQVKSPEDIPVSKCMQHELQFGNPFDYYENRISVFLREISQG